MAGAGAARVEMTRLDHPKLQLAAMKALRQVLVSLHSSIVTPVNGGRGDSGDISLDKASMHLKSLIVDGDCNTHNKGVDVEPTKEDALGEGGKPRPRRTWWKCTTLKRSAVRRKPRLH